MTNPKHPINTRPRDGYSHYDGLTKREYFAALAMQGLISNPDMRNFRNEFAKCAVELADELINELNKPQS